MNTKRKGHIILIVSITAIVAVIVGDVGFDWANGFTKGDLSVTTDIAIACITLIALVVIIGSLVMAAANSAFIQKSKDETPAPDA